jgi:cyclophilin family peptidyl-prolyl cis-trans isomerase
VPRLRANVHGALAALALASAALPGCAPRDDVAEIAVEGQGTIRVRLLPHAAPRHVQNFKELAQRGFYDGTAFHRVAPGFLIQGGDPNSKNGDPADDGQGGPGYELPPEPSGLRHAEGTVSMARGAGAGSSGSQFFIVLRNHDDWKAQLDGQYTIFGQVIDGLEIAQRIAWLPADEHQRPLQPPVITSLRVVETRRPR